MLYIYVVSTFCHRSKKPLLIMNQQYAVYSVISDFTEYSVFFEKEKNRLKILPYLSEESQRWLYDKTTYPSMRV